MPAHLADGADALVAVVHAAENCGEEVVQVTKAGGDWWVVVTRPPDPGRLTVNAEQLETRIAGRLLGGTA